MPAVGTVLLSANYEGPALPNNYTMDKLSLGALETVNPILGHLNSVYGYRDHPVDGEYKFHNGVDIGGQMGDPIGAFAAGTVEYIGENDDHGCICRSTTATESRASMPTAASCVSPRARLWRQGRRWPWLALPGYLPALTCIWRSNATGCTWTRPTTSPSLPTECVWAG